MAKNRSRRLRKKLFSGEFTVYGDEGMMEGRKEERKKTDTFSLVTR